MFKRFFLALALSLCLASGALAADNGFYLGLKFIDSIQSTGQLSKDDATSKIFDIGDYTQNTIGGGIFVGYDFYPKYQVSMRAELEYAIRTNTTTTWGTKAGVSEAISDLASDMLGTNVNADLDLKGQWNLQTLFLNAYWDFHNNTAFTPYIGAGLGLGFIRSKYELTVKANGLEDSESFNDTKTVFAWNVGAGLSWAATENLSADLAYRFVRLGYSQTEKTYDGYTVKMGMAPYANEFSLGLRYTF